MSRYDGHKETCDCAVCDDIAFRESLKGVSEVDKDLRTLATAVLTANYHKGIIYNFGGAAAAITIENAAEIARKYAE